MTMKKPILLLLAFLILVACGGGGAEDPVDSSDPTTPPTAPQPIPDDAGPVFVDSSDILLMESFPVQVALRVTGNLPTPCHELAWEVEDDGSTIAVTLASTTDPDVMCTQVLEPFEVSIPLGEFESGARDVTINGQEAGDFEI